MIGKLTPSADSDINFEVWLPAAGWNGRFQGIGNAGLSGLIGYTGPGSLAEGVNRGYATAGTDTGHQSTPVDGSWAIGH